ncbi:MAG: methylated-DNA--[protein]-cysteine S-methyltransferase [Campylobacteraceae bacterium]|jgi:methylated-DNA-[protein]-cysteine S-methyltransferase|nr:methylated-DNA--[protein]-cysteine S-methyltransferase [Campylobacteraceae bacterium]
MAIFTCGLKTPIGDMVAAGDGEAISGVWFAGQKYFPDTKEWVKAEDFTVFLVLQKWLDGYFKGEARSLPDIKLAPIGSPFQQKVWNILRQIEYGQSTTYGKIAQILAYESNAKMSSQAVGGAVGRNPISILIPCHRVLGADGSLTGYAGGVDKKLYLLKLEGAR